MTWPIDDLTVAHLDAGADDPSQARTELLAAVNKIKSILGEAPAGSTIIAASGGQISSAQIADNQVTQAKLAASCVGVNEAKTSTGEVSLVQSSVGDRTFSKLVLPGGQFGFYPRFKTSLDVPSTNVYAQFAGGINATSTPYMRVIDTTYETVIDLQVSSNSASVQTAYVEQSYFSASPPYAIGGLDFGLFIYALVDKFGKVKSVSTSPDPTWWTLNPVPDRVDDKGCQYLKTRKIPDHIKSLKEDDPETYLLELSKLKTEYIKVTKAMKNRFMNKLPHPFKSVESGDKVVLLSPAEHKANLLYDLQKQGESINELIHKDLIRLDDDTDAEAPGGVKICKFKFKNKGSS